MDKIVMRWIFLALLFLTVPLMGMNSTDATGCSCGSAGESGPTTEGVTATSKSYTLNRSEIGGNFQMSTSSAKTYRSNTTVGDCLSEGKTASSSYKISHTLSQDVVSVPIVDPYAETPPVDPYAATPPADTPPADVAAPALM